MTYTEDTLTNLLFILAKRHLYYCRSKQQTPSLENYKNYVSKIHYFKSQIATTNFKLDKYLLVLQKYLIDYVTIVK